MLPSPDRPVQFLKNLEKVFSVQKNTDPDFPNFIRFFSHVQFLTFSNTAKMHFNSFLHFKCLCFNFQWKCKCKLLLVTHCRLLNSRKSEKNKNNKQNNKLTLKKKSQPSDLPDFSLGKATQQYFFWPNMIVVIMVIDSHCYKRLRMQYKLCIGVTILPLYLSRNWRI